MKDRPETPILEGAEGKAQTARRLCRVLYLIHEKRVGFGEGPCDCVCPESGMSPKNWRSTGQAIDWLEKFVDALPRGNVPVEMTERWHIGPDGKPDYHDIIVGPVRRSGEAISESSSNSEGCEGYGETKEEVGPVVPRTDQEDRARYQSRLRSGQGSEGMGVATAPRPAVSERDTAEVQSKREAVVRADGLRHHCLKTWPAPFEDVKADRKPFEYRPFDRDFRVGDILVLEKWDPDTKRYQGEIERRRVTYVLPGGAFGVPAQFCILGIEREDRGESDPYEVAALLVERQASIHRMRAQSFADDSDRADGEAQADDIDRATAAAEALEYTASRIRELGRKGGGG